MKQQKYLDLSPHLLQSLSHSSDRSQKLKDQYPHLYTIMQGTDNDLILTSELLQAFHFDLEPQYEKNDCQDFAYIYKCRTCELDGDIDYCPNCFDKQDHRGHNYIVQKNKNGCSCQKWWKSDLRKCKVHKVRKIEYNQLAENIKIESSLLGYCCFLIQVLDRHISKIRDKRLIIEKCLNAVMSKVLKLCRKDHRYVQATAFCFIFNKLGEQNLLKKLLQLNKQERCITNQIKSIVQQCLSVQPFAIKMIQEIFSLKSMKQSFDFCLIQPLSAAVKDLLISPQFLACLIKKQKLSDFPSMVPIYYELFLKQRREGKKKSENLLIICKHLEKNCKLQYYMQIKQFKEVIINSASLDRSFLKSLTKKRIQKKVYKPIEVLKNDNQWFNEIVSSILICLNGNIQIFHTFFLEFDHQLVRKFVNNYFLSIFRAKFKYKCNGLTMVCLFRLAKYFHFQQLISSLGSSAKQMRPLSVAKFSQNLFIILRSLIASQHVKGRKLMEIGQIIQDEDLVQEGKREIKGWFQDFLASEKKITKQCLVKLNVQFDEIEDFFQKETQENEEGIYFVYTGQQREIKNQFWLSTEKKMEKIQVKYEQYDKQVIQCRQQVREILIVLFSENILVVNLREKDFRSLPSNERYRVCLVGVLLDYFVKGRCEKIKKYVEQLKEIVNTIRKKDQRFSYLFSSPVEKRPSPLIFTSKTEQSQQQPMIPSVILECQKTLSLSPETRQKRFSKLAQIKEKFKSKAIKYRIQPEQSQMIESCLVCRQNEGQPKAKFIFAYLGNLKKDAYSQLIFNRFGSDLILSTCYHPIHFKCVNHKLVSCILCKSNCNISLPVLNKTMESEVFAQVWWTDFMTKTKLFQNKQIAWYNGNKQIEAAEDAIKQNRIREELKNNPFRNFLIILKSFVIELAKISIFLKRIQSLSVKNTYLFDLMKFYIQNLKAHQKEALQECLQKLVSQLKQQKITQYTKDCTLSILRGLKIKLNLAICPLQSQNLQKDLAKILEKYPSEYTQKFRQVISWLFHRQFKQTQPSNHKKGLSQIIKFLFNVDLPKDMEQAYSHRIMCQACFKMRTSFCLICRQYLCTPCTDWSKHWREFHSNPIIIMSLETGKMKEVGRGNSEESQLYYSVFGNQFTQSCRELRKYRLNLSKLFSLISRIIMKG